VVLSIIYKRELVEFFISDPVVVEIASNSMLAYSLVTLFDAFQQIMTGIIKGIGAQESASIAAIISLVFISLPMSAVLCFYFDLGLPGMWYGYGTGLVVLSILYLRVVLSKDQWDLAAREAQEEAAKEHNMYAIVGN
jgi:MATE family multidrug resistance protein